MIVNDESKQKHGEKLPCFSIYHLMAAVKPMILILIPYTTYLSVRWVTNLV